MPDLKILILFVLAFSGHFILVVASHNRFYGHPFSRILGDSIQLLHVFLGILGVFLIWLGVLQFSNWYESKSFFEITLSGCYVVFALITLFVLFPVKLMVDRSFRLPLVQNIIGNYSFKKECSSGRPFPENFFLNQCYELRVNEIQIPFGLSSKSRQNHLRILHISDLHVGGLKNKCFFQKISQVVSELNPDLLVATGDFVDGPRFSGWLPRILGNVPTTLGKFAILGNHDLWNVPEYVHKSLSRAGFKVLQDRWTNLDFGSVKIGIFGLSYPWFSKEFPLLAENHSDFKILLSHSPDQVNWAVANHFDLMISGHVHGGQIVVPGLGPILVPSVFGRRFSGGTYKVENTILSVSKGVGGSFPLRINCHPEINLLNLQFMES